MKLISIFAQKLDPEDIERLGIDEDTVFETYFTGGTLYVRPLSEDEEDELDWTCPVTDAVCDGECENCPVYLAFQDSQPSCKGCEGR